MRRGTRFTDAERARLRALAQLDQHAGVARTRFYRELRGAAFAAAGSVVAFAFGPGWFGVALAVGAMSLAAVAGTYARMFRDLTGCWPWGRKR